MGMSRYLEQTARSPEEGASRLAEGLGSPPTEMGLDRSQAFVLSTPTATTCAGEDLAAQPWDLLC